MADVTAPLSFQSRDMAQALYQMKPPKRLLIDTFVNRTMVHSTDTFDIDFVTAVRSLAPFVSPRSAAPVVNKIGFTSAAYKAPYVKVKKSFETANYLNRGAGEVTYSGVSANERIAAALGAELQAMRDEIRRREEWMVMKQLTSGTGIVAFSGIGVDAQINNGFKSSHNVTPGVAWTAAGGTPIDDLQTWRRLIVQDSGLSNNFKIIFSNGAWSKFINNAQVKTMLDLFHFQIGAVSSVAAENPAGAIYHGTLQGFDMWEYTDFYQDRTISTGALATEVDMMPANTLILASSDLRATRHYGAIQDIEASGQVVSVAEPYFVKSWIEPDPAVRFIMMQSAPLPLIEQVDGSVLATVS